MRKQIAILKQTALLFLLAASTGFAGTYRLPADAAIIVGKPQWDHKDPSNDHKDPSNEVFCPEFRLTERQVRFKFATYRLLVDDDLHDSYAYPSCRINGAVTVHGHRFPWQARPGNTMATDWPDGTTKILGGNPAMNQAGKEKLLSRLRAWRSSAKKIKLILGIPLLRGAGFHREGGRE